MIKMNENEMSRGSLRIPLRGLPAIALFGGLTVAVAGCPGPAPMSGGTGGGGHGGAGGEASSSSSSSSSSSTTTSSSTGGPMCTMDKDCPGSPTLCKVPTCLDGKCTYVKEPAGTTCMDNEGKFCDGLGHCLACLE